MWDSCDQGPDKTGAILSADILLTLNHMLNELMVNADGNLKYVTHLTWLYQRSISMNGLVLVK